MTTTREEATTVSRTVQDVDQDVDQDATRVSPVTLLARRGIPVALVLTIFAVLARTASLPLSNPDTFFHLRFGQEFLDGWSLRNPGSPTAVGTADWVPTQWLPQMVMAGLDDRFGLAAVAWFAGLQFVAFALVVYVAARRWADPVVAAPIVMFTVIVAAPALSMRPQVMSYVLVTVTAAAWFAARASGRTPWLLVPLTWFWATYHGMWPTGIVISLVACLGLALDGDARGRRLLRHLAVPVLSAVAAALTPVGPRLYGAVLEVSSRGQYFSEWGPPTFTAPNCLALLVVLGVTTLVMVKRRDNRWTEILVLALAAGWAVYSARTVPVAGALLVPVTAMALQGLTGPRTGPTRLERGLVWGGAGLSLVVLALVTPHTADKPAPQPSWVAPSLSSLPAGTRILDDSSFGGYLMWAYPQLDVTLSGYGDVYTDAELERNHDIEGVSPGWDDMVRDLDVQYAVMSPKSSLTYALELAGWRVLHESPTVEMLEAPADW